ncbi:MAG: imidazolonepropionase [Thaumarchaeota archaeon]|nr:imidazolonepropionase [Nitrososphaerota archaeon]
MADLALVHAGELVTCDGTGEEGLGIVQDGALLCDGGRVVWTGTTRELGRRLVGKAVRRVDAQGGLVAPGFVDPHTHLVFAGSREDELERKVKGESYTSILNKGGGILRTIRETRRASVASIASESADRLDQLLSNGVTTAEVKTGYGQDLKGETKLLTAIGRLRKRSPVELVSTFLGLHATPPEFGKAKEYVDHAIRKMLPMVASMKERPSFSDCFCEEGVFSAGECERYLRASRELGFACKIHADEFSDSGGATLAAKMKCVSADHLGSSSAEGAMMMGKEGVVAVLLPATSLYSGIRYADSRRLAEAGCRVALGTDLSPNSWVESPQFVMGLACAGLRMTPAEALKGFTVNAALALGRPDLGRLTVGAPADFVLHSIASYEFLAYRVGGHYVRSVYKGGREVYASPEV